MPLTATELIPTRVIVRSADVVSADCQQETVLLSLERGRCYGMNRVGSHIWRKLEKPIRVDEMLSSLVSEFHADPESAGREAMEFLEELMREKLIVSTDNGGEPR